VERLEYAFRSNASLIIDPDWEMTDRRISATVRSIELNINPGRQYVVQRFKAL
jgi:hypothetical protein